MSSKLSQIPREFEFQAYLAPSIQVNDKNFKKDLVSQQNKVNLDYFLLLLSRQTNRHILRHPDQYFKH